MVLVVVLSQLSSVNSFWRSYKLMWSVVMSTIFVAHIFCRFHGYDCNTNLLNRKFILCSKQFKFSSNHQNWYIFYQKEINAYTVNKISTWVSIWCIMLNSWRHCHWWIHLFQMIITFTHIFTPLFLFIMKTKKAV